MASPTYAQIYVPPAKQEIAWGVEKVAAGTPAAAYIVEPCKPSLVLMSDMYTADEYFGTGVHTDDWVEMTHHAELTLAGDLRVDGYGGQAGITIVGDKDNSGGAEALTVITPLTKHVATPGVPGNRMNTHSFDYSTGSPRSGGGVDILHLTYGMLDSLKVTATPNLPLKYEAKLLCFFPGVGTAFQVAPMQMASIGRIKSTGGTFTLNNSAGAAYAAKLLSCSVTLQRNTKAIYSPSSGHSDPLNPLDFFSDELQMLIDNVDFVYDAIGDGSTPTPYYDFMNKKTWGGAAGSESIFKWSDGATVPRTFEIHFWKAGWSDLKHTEQDNAIHLQGSGTTWQDYAALTGTTPAYSSPSSIVVTNATGGAMLF